MGSNIRSKILGAVVFHPAHYAHLGKILLEVNAHIGVLLVIPQ